MSVPAILARLQDPFLMAWLKLKITHFLDDCFTFVKRFMRHKWLRFWVSLKAVLTLASFSSHGGNKRAILVGLMSVAALLFTWRLHRNHRLKPCPAPKKTNNKFCGLCGKSSHERAAFRAPTFEADLQKKLFTTGFLKTNSMADKDGAADSQQNHGSAFFHDPTITCSSIDSPDTKHISRRPAPAQVTALQAHFNQEFRASQYPSEIPSATKEAMDGEDPFHASSYTKKKAGRDKIDILYTVQNTAQNNLNLSIRAFPNSGSRSVPIMAGVQTDDDFKYENRSPLSQPIDTPECRRPNAWRDDGDSRILPPGHAAKPEHLTHHCVDMYKLVDVIGGDDRINYGLKFPHGLYQEKLRTYDKYLADPKLSVQLRSQVQRAKLYLQKYYELDGQ